MNINNHNIEITTPYIYHPSRIYHSWLGWDLKIWSWDWYRISIYPVLTISSVSVIAIAKEIKSMSLLLITLAIYIDHPSPSRRQCFSNMNMIGVSTRGELVYFSLCWIFEEFRIKRLSDVIYSCMKMPDISFSWLHLLRIGITEGS